MAPRSKIKLALVSGVNDRALDRRKTKILANPNPATVILSRLFHLLEPAYGLAKAVTLVLQQVSALNAVETARRFVGAKAR